MVLWWLGPKTPIYLTDRDRILFSSCLLRVTSSYTNGWLFGIDANELSLRNAPNPRTLLAGAKTCCQDHRKRNHEKVEQSECKPRKSRWTSTVYLKSNTPQPKHLNIVTVVQEKSSWFVASRWIKQKPSRRNQFKVSCCLQNMEQKKSIRQRSGYGLLVFNK